MYFFSCCIAKLLLILIFTNVESTELSAREYKSGWLIHGTSNIARIAYFDYPYGDSFHANPRGYAYRQYISAGKIFHGGIPLPKFMYNIFKPGTRIPENLIFMGSLDYLGVTFSEKGGLHSRNTNNSIALSYASFGLGASYLFRKPKIFVKPELRHVLFISPTQSSDGLLRSHSYRNSCLACWGYGITVTRNFYKLIEFIQFTKHDMSRYELGLSLSYFHDKVRANNVKTSIRTLNLGISLTFN